MNVTRLNSNIRHLTPVSPTTDWEAVLNDWLSLKAPTTARSYRKDVENFLKDTNQILGSFLTCDRSSAFEVVSQYKGQMLNRNLSPATINRRLSAIKSLISYGYKAGHCEYDLSGMIDGVKSRSYRDTTGINLEQFKMVVCQCPLSTILGVRDYAILSLLWSNALRRGEVSRLKLTDFDPQGNQLRIIGKGRKESELIGLSDQVVEAIQAYLTLRDDDFDGLFISHDFAYFGHQLSSESIAKIVKKYCKLAGIDKPMSPHRIRHSSITTALDKTNGNVRAVQKLSRHSDLNTLMIYDDNRVNQQKEMSDLLSDLL